LQPSFDFTNVLKQKKLDRQRFAMPNDLLM
jgi:hypothetical protein